MVAIKDALRLSELLCARLVHDLSGLAGSVRGVLEVASEETSAQLQTVRVASDTASDLMLRLRLQRAAWGPDPQALSVGDLHELCPAINGAHRLTVDTTALLPSTVFPPAIGKLVLNLLLLGAQCLPSGGTIRVAGTSSDVFIQIIGPRAAWPPGMGACFVDESEAVAALASPRDLQMPLTALMAQGSGLRLSMLMGPGGDPPPLRLSIR